MENKRTNTAKDQFFIFCSINIGILGVIMGAIISTFELTFSQCVMVAILGPLSYFLVGAVSLAGKDQGNTTLALSKQVYGSKGNIILNLISWINFLGWLIINTVSSALIVLSIFSLLSINNSSFVTILSLVIVLFIVISCCLVPDEKLGKIQMFFSIVFGGATLFILGYLLLNMDFTPLYQRESGDFATNFLPALSIMIAGTGLGWVMAGADYSPMVKKDESNKKVFFAVSFGGIIPLIIMFFSGILMSANMPDLASSANPLDIIAASLPAYLAIPYYIISVGGLLPQCIIGLKTSDINLNTIVKVKNKRTTIIIHSICIFAIALIALLGSGMLLTYFSTFLTVIGMGAGSWAAIFIVNYIKRKSFNDYAKIKEVPFNKNACISWAIATIVGFLFTNNAFFDGPFAQGIFRDNSLGLLISTILAAILYLVLAPVFKEEFPKDEN